jgi:flagellar hook-length control protein FliK
MMDVGAVIPVSLDAVRALSLADAAREGRILEAKVTAMLSNSLARLAINGLDVDVTTPHPLPIGATLTLKAERDGGQVRLVTQGPLRDPEGQPIARSAPPALPEALSEPVKTVLAKVQAMAVQAALGDEPTPITSTRTADIMALLESEARPATAAPSLPARPAGLEAQMLAASLAATASEAARPDLAPPPPLIQQAAAARTLTQPLATSEEMLADMEAELLAASLAGGGEVPDELLARVAPDPRAVPHPAAANPERAVADLKAATAAFTAFAADEVAPGPEEAALARLADADVIRQLGAADLSGSPARIDRPAHFVIDLPLYFPGNPMPLRLEVEREDSEAESEDGSTRPSPSWTIRFATEAGSLGMIHAAITMFNEQIGVNIWAERHDTATLFAESAPQLQDALEASDLSLDALRITEGRPPERPAPYQEAAR